MILTLERERTFRTSAKGRVATLAPGPKADFDAKPYKWTWPTAAMSGERTLNLSLPAATPTLHLAGERVVQGKKKLTIGMAIGVAAGMILYRILFG